MNSYEVLVVLFPKYFYVRLVRFSSAQSVGFLLEQDDDECVTTGLYLAHHTGASVKETDASLYKKFPK